MTKSIKMFLVTAISICFLSGASLAFGSDPMGHKMGKGKDQTHKTSSGSEGGKSHGDDRFGASGKHDKAHGSDHSDNKGGSKEGSDSHHDKKDKKGSHK